MRFFLHMSGGGGCDYTMACNQVLYELKECKTIEEAIEIVRESVEDNEYCEEAKILIVHDTWDVPVDQFKSDYEDKEQKRKKQDDEEKEKSLYEKLRAKYKK